MGSDHVSTLPDTDSKFLLQRTQKRTLPSSFQSLISKPSVPGTRFHRGASVTQQKEPRQGKLVNGSEVDLINMASFRSKIDKKLAQQMQKRSLPPSLQQTVYRTAAEGPIDYNGDNHFSNFV